MQSNEDHPTSPRLGELALRAMDGLRVEPKCETILEVPSEGRRKGAVPTFVHKATKG